jgi:hypothetical protein
MDKQREEFVKWAILFHETYERLAPKFGYETRKEYRDFDSASNNGQLMIAVCSEVIPAAQAAMLHEVERWHNAYITAHNQAMANGEKYQDCQAKLKRYEDAFSKPHCWIDPDDLQMDNESGIIYVTKTSFDGCTVPLFTKPEGE